MNALDGISFDAEHGEWIAIMGPSGSGKTTLLNLIGCLDQATSGAVRIGGTDMLEAASAANWPGSAARPSGSSFSSSIWCRI